MKLMLMKFTVIKNGRNDVPKIRRMDALAFFDKIRTDDKGRIAALREYVYWSDNAERYDRADKIERVYPLAVLKYSVNNSLEFSIFNYITWLHIGGLRHESELKMTKDAVVAMPSTLAAFVAADGVSLEVLVAIRPKSCSVPDNEADVNELCLSAHDTVSRVYGALIPYGQIVRQRITVRSSMMWPFDAEPYVNIDAAPISVDGRMGGLVAKPEIGNDSVREGMEELDRNERMYAQAVRQSRKSLDGLQDVRECAALLTELAHRLRAMGMEEHAAYWQLRAHCAHRTWFDESFVRDIVTAAYAEDQIKGLPRFADGEAESSRLFERFVMTNYQLRYNVMMLRAEYRRKDAPYTDWQPVDERIQNTILRDARNAGLRVHGNDARTYVNSTKVAEYNPVVDYLYSLNDKWDCKTDYIGRLADTVPCDIPQWKTWFRKWFLYMVAQWIGKPRGYGNSMVPLLISEQGYNKTTFCGRLLPPELREFYIDNLQPSDKRQMMMAMHQFLLISLEEFNQISPLLQSGFLKQIITMPSVKVKRPYGKHVEDFPRMASFIGSTNAEEVLSDPSGSRRFIGVRLTGPIDVSEPLNYEQLYAQAMDAIRQGEQYWLTRAEEEAIIEHNRQFQVRPTVMELFYEYFEVVDVAAYESSGEGEWLSPTEIYKILRTEVGSSLEVGSVPVLGRHLTQSLPMTNKKKGKNTMLYLVKVKR